MVTTDCHRKSHVRLLCWQMRNVTVIPRRHVFFHGVADFIFMIKSDRIFCRSFSKKQNIFWNFYISQLEVSSIIIFFSSNDFLNRVD